MSSQSGPQSAHLLNSSPTNARHGTALPPIVPPHEISRSMNDPQSAGSVSFPPLSRASSLSSNDGPNKMHHILNPAGVPGISSKPPTPDVKARPQQLPPISVSRSSSSERSGPVQSPYGSAPPLGATHRITAHNLATPTGSIDAKKSPFLPTTGPGMPLGSGHVQPTSQPYGPKPAYPFPPQGPQHPVSMPRRDSDTMSAHGSRTGSPTPSYSSYGPPSTAQGSPRNQYSAVTHHGQAMYHSQHSGSSVPQRAPSPQQMQHSSGHFPPPHHHAMLQRGGPYHMIMDTAHGPIQIPMDVNTASKMADEKRKRNAGASARFRQRRKEKEKESATTISKLEDKVRELTDQTEFYRGERDYFRDLVYKNEGARAHLVPRMPSPESVSEPDRQGSLTSSREGGRSPSSGTVEYKETGDRGSDDGRIVRRRISGYEPEQRAASHQERQQDQHQQLPSPSHHLASGQQNPHDRYSYPRPDARGSAPGSSSHVPPHAHGMPPVPHSMRAGPYESGGHTKQNHYDMRWAAPS